jgi:hypothetical protein
MPTGWNDCPAPIREQRGILCRLARLPGSGLGAVTPLLYCHYRHGFWSALFLLAIASLYGTHVTDSLSPEANRFFPPRLIVSGFVAYLLGIGIS